MRKLLLLTYFFPPIGGAGVQRNAKLARYLPRLGWELVVVTGPGLPDYAWAPIDHTMVEEIPPAVQVHRVPGPEPAFSSGRRDRAERWLFYRSPWQRWWEQVVVPTALDVGRDADLVYASLAPYTTAQAAVSSARGLGKPLVVDLEDPWAFDEMMIYPTVLHRRVEFRRMQRALASADGVVMNTPEAATRVRQRFPELARALVTAIPNGYDAADFEGPAPVADGKVRIVHAGSLHTEFALRHHRLRPMRALLGGSVQGIDLLTRSHVFLLEAIGQLVSERPELSRRLELHLVGALT
ncbi:MAG: glycosyltransferase family 4 protein, partial [Thermoleophilia bacterium]|nr:glycosyltransferase family 4 protein [Thermoleophilia bacterium]